MVIPLSLQVLTRSHNDVVYSIALWLLVRTWGKGEPHLCDTHMMASLGFSLRASTVDKNEVHYYSNHLFANCMNFTILIENFYFQQRFYSWKFGEYY